MNARKFPYLSPEWNSRPASLCGQAALKKGQAAVAGSQRPSLNTTLRWRKDFTHRTLNWGKIYFFLLQYVWKFVHLIFLIQTKLKIIEEPFNKAFRSWFTWNGVDGYKYACGTFTGANIYSSRAKVISSKKN